MGTGQHQALPELPAAAYERKAEHGARTDMRREKPRRYISGLWIFLLSCLPGLNFMALGLMKRGLFFMSAFFGLISLIGFFRYMAVFPLVILIFASLCDAQNKRRRINNGEYVNDDIDDILRFVAKYKVPLLAVFAFMTVHSLFSSSFGMGGHMRIPLVPILVCIAGWYFIKNRGSKISKGDHGSHDHDSHNIHDHSSHHTQHNNNSN